MPRKPLVSIVVPSHNRARLLRRTLQSILNQRMSDLEVIVVDDGSTDDTPTVIAGADPRVRMLRNSTPAGVSYARNRGIAAALGEWVAFCDDDDLWSPEKLTRQLEAAEHAGRDWAYAGDVNVDDALRVLSGAPPPTPDEVVALLPRWNPVASGGSSVIVRSRVLAGVGGFDPTLHRTEDWDLWIRIARTGHPAWVCEPLVAYRFHAGNVVGNPGEMVEEARRLATRHRIPVDLAAMHRRAAWAALRGGRRLVAVRHYAHAFARGDLRSVGRAALALLHPKVGGDGLFGLLRRDDAWVARAEPWLSAFARAHTGRPELSLIAWGRRAATLLLGTGSVNHAMRALARARGHRLVLVYHRVGACVPRGCELIPTVPAPVFRAQLEALREVVDLVNLGDILVPRNERPRPGSLAGRPAVALTFDDDLPSHAECVLPLLRELAIPAAFFLSGRALHGLGPYWFQELEAVLHAHGELRTAALLGVRAASPGVEWVQNCEGDATVRQSISALARDLAVPGILAREGLTALAAAGMTIGFHTVDHSVLPGMEDSELSRAVTRGRDELARAAGTRVRYLAYPYGKADTRTAAAVALAGFEAAFTGRPEPLRRSSDRYRIGRWEPGPLGVDDLLVKLAVRLHRAAPDLAQRPA